jgi:hypothetical protein
MHILRPLSRANIVVLVTSILTGCAVTPDDIDTGVSIPLTTTSASGATYRLTNATFNFTGPETLSVPTSGDEPSLEVALSPGSYQLELAAGWRLELIEGGMARPVDALLVSQAVQRIDVLPGSLSQAYYQFLLSAEGSGSVSISFGVTEASTLTGTLEYTVAGCDPTTCPPPSTVVTQIAFPPLVAQQVSSDARELWLNGSGAVLTVYGDSPDTAMQQLTGSSIEMRLRSASPDLAQELSIGLENAVNGVTIDIAIGPTSVTNGIGADGFPLAPTELAFQGPLAVHQIAPTGEVYDLVGTATMTYRAPSTCTPNGGGCGTP